MFLVGKIPRRSWDKIKEIIHWIFSFPLNNIRFRRIFTIKHPDSRDDLTNTLSNF